MELFGLMVPSWVMWAAVGLIVVLIIVFIAIGFFKELRKK